MADIVYILGAGINRGIKDWNGLAPPLAKDFFQQALRHPRIGDDHYRDRLKLVFAYIEKYWKISSKDLESVEFDIESCFTMLELQSKEALSNNDRETFVSLVEINYRLIVMLAEYLSEFEHFTHTSEPFKLFGQRIYDESSAVLTFNYDTLLESALESASGVNINIPTPFIGRSPESNEISDEELPYSHMNWNRPLVYGVEFDEVQLHRAGTYAFATGERFYAHPSNQLYIPPLLKLHGSINWFKFSGIKKYPFGDEEEIRKRKGKTLLFESTWRFNEAPELYGIIIEPLIITPIINKEISSDSIIFKIWQKAQDEMSACKRLIVGGYSFPPTDFHTRRLFLEAFSSQKPEEIVVINPDTSVVQLVKELCHFKKPVLVCKDLEEFITLN